MAEDKTKTIAPSNFIKEIVDGELTAGKHEAVVSRFPPEPNGYLHIGHAKSICLNFGLAAQYGGRCHLRFDDTNPSTEETEYVESIKEDIHWLGFDWAEHEYYASDYFEQLYQWAELLIGKGLAYVDDLAEDEAREYRGNFFNKGKNSPFRDRTPEENLDLFRRMRAGEFPDGSRTLRAKIDMTHPNMNMRDPIMYRIKRAHHHRTGDDWLIYPMYDYAHGQSDAIENITHSVCTLEFEDHRPLYDWFLEAIGVEKPPRQIEFARLNLSYTVVSKRKLLQLVRENIVDGWDDPRMPTIAGIRRRGYPAESIRRFSERVGVAKADSTIDVALLEHTVRDVLNESSPRVMAVLRPLKVTITNFPEDEVMEIDAPYMPEDFSRGSRNVPFTREIFVEQDDFREDPPKKWYRLTPGGEVRLRYACIIRCEEVVKDDEGRVVELKCTWDPNSKGGNPADGRKIRGTLHWVSARFGVPAQVRLYDRLFVDENPDDAAEGGSFLDNVNPDSLEIVDGAIIEPSLSEAAPGDRVQFERLGYFCVDTKLTTPDRLVFNRTVTLRDTWAKIEKKQGGDKGAKKAKAKADRKSADGVAAVAPEIEFDAFAKLDLRVGVVREASRVEGADRLLRLLVDIGEEKPRQIIAGIRPSYPEPAELVGKQVMVVANLKPRQMKFGLSEGMILSGGRGKSFRVVTFDGELKPGDKVS
ncbi:MAG: glutamine--tRNA ligase/YqeY domain fusion protein [Candidatus Lernaella stagnicola]|nr:glutamine--tRNA ligase/YqeY domain fusion protein [Candidatus Lernaella stagnicola]